MAELEQELLKLGLTEKEASVYLATLELGAASVQNIAKKSGVNRATTYLVLSSLIKKGLASTFLQGKRTQYAATDPEALESMYELEKRELEERQRQFSEHLLPSLKLVNNRQASKPVVKFYEGKAGLASCYNEFVARYKNTDGNETAHIFYNKDLIDQTFTHAEREKYRKFRVTNQVPVKTLYVSDRVVMENSPDAVRIKLPAGDFPTTCDIGVHGDSMRILTVRKGKYTGVLITDPDVCESMTSVFKLAWEAAEARETKASK